MTPGVLSDMTTPFDNSPVVKPPRRTFLGGLRGNFLTGLVVIAPIGLTVWLVWTVIGWVDGFVLPLVPYRFSRNNISGSISAASA